MNSQQLLDLWRSQVVDQEIPYLWSDEEGYAYMDQAYRMFVRLTGGIPDITSEATRVSVVANEDQVELHPSLLRIMDAWLTSDDSRVKVINFTDLNSVASDVDYGYLSRMMRKNSPGRIAFLLTGQERNKAQLLGMPQADDELSLQIYRLPLTNVVDGTHPLNEVDSDHHFYLMDWMKHLAYGKQDAETFDKGKSEEFGSKFYGYAEQCKAEWARYKHKTRVVTYGGI